MPEEKGEENEFFKNSRCRGCDEEKEPTLFQTGEKKRGKNGRARFHNHPPSNRRGGKKKFRLQPSREDRKEKESRLGVDRLWLGTNVWKRGGGEPREHLKCPLWEEIKVKGRLLVFLKNKYCGGEKKKGNTKPSRRKRKRYKQDVTTLKKKKERLKRGRDVKLASSFSGNTERVIMQNLRYGNKFHSQSVSDKKKKRVQYQKGEKKRV